MFEFDYFLIFNVQRQCLKYRSAVMKQTSKVEASKFNSSELGRAKGLAFFCHKRLLTVCRASLFDEHKTQHKICLRLVFF